MEIIWKGNEHTNSSSRRNHVPIVIVNHISVGSMNSMDAWFTSPNNNQSSAHYGVAKDGRIHQYVDIKRNAWTQGIRQDQIANARAQIVREQGVNPNLYSVSIEHEGHTGDLTEKQFAASVWLHFHIRDQVRTIWGHEISLDREHVLGHYQVNPTGKPYCPGPDFPWERLYAELSNDNREGDRNMEQQLKNLEERIAQLSDRVSRLESLTNMPNVPEWAAEAVQRAVEQGIVQNPQRASYDFYRLITVLHRKGII